MVIQRIFSAFKTPSLYFPGDHTKFKLKYEYQNYKEIFKRLGIKYTEMNKHLNCGIEAYEAGYTKVAKELAQKNQERFIQKGIKHIITNDPSCYYMFSEIYPKLLTNWDITVEHASEVILTALKKRAMFPMNEESLSYNDSPQLANDKTREIITLFNGTIKEPNNAKELALVSAGHGGISRNHPERAREINTLIVSQFPEEIKKIVTASAVGYLELKEYDERFIELSTYVLGKLRAQKI